MATLAGVPPCAGEGRRACGILVGDAAADPDLRDFCGASGRAAQPLDVVRNRAVASATLDPWVKPQAAAGTIRQGRQGFRGQLLSE